MDYLDHFGLSDEPFSNDPRARFHHPSREYVDAARRALRGALQAKGLCVVVGDVGCSKTTIARSLLDGLDEAAFETSLLVLATVGSDPAWLLSRIARQIGVPQPQGERVALLAQIFDRLVAIREHGRRAVLIFDDAHQLTEPEALADLRAILNFEHDEQSLVTVILIGLPELERTLALDPALAQRVEIHVHLSPLSAESAEAYLRYRIRQAGGDDMLLAPEAVEALHRLSGGVPRLLNVLADNALFEAQLAGRKAASGDDVEQAAEDLGIGGAAPGPRSWLEPVGAIEAAVADAVGTSDLAEPYLSLEAEDELACDAEPLLELDAADADSEADHDDELSLGPELDGAFS